MKKILAVFVALMALCFTQCKPAPEGDEENNGNNDTRMVKVRCEIPINNGTRSDFTNLIEEGRINWSEGRECVYLAIHGDNPQLIELESWSDGNQPVLEFTGEAAEGLIESGEEYDVWYFGHSQQLETPYINNDGEAITGSIANQSGHLEDLGYCHIATTSVKAVTESGDVRLNLSGVLKTQVAIALLDLENVTELYGDAIVGTEYALEYNGERFELNVTEDTNAKICVESASGISYVVLFPNDNKESTIKSVQDSKVYGYTFQNYIKANKVYCRVASDGKTAETLTWQEKAQNITVNGISFTMIAVEGGTFQMGATSEQGGNYESDELPVHSVTLSSYYIGETVVTQELWQAVMGNNPSYFSGNPQRPVEQVSWNDCQEFIAKLNQLIGKNFRLPTEAEWEYAARGGSKSKSYKYSGSNTIGDVAWYTDNSSSRTHDVKTKQANELGIYDMSGNVWEWCQDWYSSSYYSSSPENNPTGPSSSSRRVLRGGSWIYDAKYCRVSYRGNGSPDLRNGNRGLRLAL